MTLRKNSRLLKHALDPANIVGVKDYSLESGFVGEPCDALGHTGEPEIDSVPWAWVGRAARKFRADFMLNGPGLLTVYYHSNHWLRVEFKPQAP